MPPSGANHTLYSVAASLGLATLTVYLLVVGEDILIPLVLAIFISYLITALGHFIRRLRIGKWRPPGWMGLTAAILLVVIVIAVIVQLVAGSIVDVVAEAPRYQDRLQDMFTKVTAFIRCASVAARDETVRRGFSGMVSIGNDRLAEYLEALTAEGGM